MNAFMDTQKKIDLSNSQLTNLQTDLDCDPFYYITRLAVLALMAEEKVKKNKDIKFRIYIEEQKVYIQDSSLYDKAKNFPPFYVGISFYQDPQQLVSLPIHIARCLTWFPPQTNSNHENIYRTVAKALNYLIESLPPKEQFTKECLNNYKNIIDKAIISSDLSEIGFKFKISDLKAKESSDKENKLTPEEKREIELYDKISPLWDAQNIQTIKNQIEKKQIKPLRVFLNGQLEKFQQIKL